MGMFSVSLVSRSPKDTRGLRRLCEQRVRLTTPYQARRNMRKLHKAHVLNPAERTCQCEQHVGLCDVHLCTDSLDRLRCRHGGDVKRASVSLLLLVILFLSKYSANLLHSRILHSNLRLLVFNFLTSKTRLCRKL